MPIPPSSVLYYPTIDIPNEEWLRTATLFWDSVRTIVPEGIRHPYSTRFARELNDEGFLAPVRVASGMEEIEALSEEVLDYLSDPASTDVLFGGKGKRGTRIHPEKLPREIRRIADIHPDKLPNMIRDEMQDMLSEGGFLRVGEEFAAFYMTLLAKQLSNRLGIGLVTGSSAADQLAVATCKGKALRNSDISYASGKRFGRDYRAFGRRRVLPREIANGAMIDLMVQGVKLPPDISARSLVQFRQSHSEELGMLRREIMRLVSELPEAPSVDALRQAVHDQYEANVRPALKSLRTSLTAQGWDAVSTGFLKASFMSVAPTSALVIAGVPTTVALVAGVGVSLTATAVTLVSQRRRSLAENPYTYLLSIDRNW